ncbi:DUF2306 domain-containing protein [Pseudoxanthomonas sp.]|mgnify:CR=1 FL=1|uniref:DUF2306 domain-containing protein n=1 Tax=Pseudoxanthomonas sp. TaxID=1871049 RepID=UPI002FE20851
MRTPPPATMPSLRRWSAPRVAAYLVLAAVTVWGVDFLLDVIGKYRHVDATTYAMFWDRRAWLWTHLAGGALTVVLGPVQFLTQRWRRAGRVHRWTGRVYLTGMLVASTGAVGLIATSPAPFGIRLAFAATALAWLSTALVALVLIRRGQVQRHGAWMTRNYLVTLAPITFRLFLHLPAVFTVLPPPPDGIAWLLWLSWLVPLAVHEAGRRIWRATLGTSRALTGSTSPHRA